MARFSQRAVHEIAVGDLDGRSIGILLARHLVQYPISAVGIRKDNRRAQFSVG